MVAAENLLRPLATYFRQLLMQDQGLGCDETTVTLVTPTVMPTLTEDVSARDQRRRAVDEAGCHRQKELAVPRKP